MCEFRSRSLKTEGKSELQKFQIFHNRFQQPQSFRWILGDFNLSKAKLCMLYSAKETAAGRRLSHCNEWPWGEVVGGDTKFCLREPNSSSVLSEKSVGTNRCEEVSCSVLQSDWTFQTGISKISI